MSRASQEKEMEAAAVEKKLRIYADISPEIHSLMRIHCAEKGITHKQFLEETISEKIASVHVSGARVAVRRLQKKGK